MVRALVVDDDAICRLLIAEALKTCAIEVEEAASLSDAVHRWVHARSTGQAFGVIFLDVHLPDGDGLDILKDIRQAETELGLGRKQRCKVLMVSADEHDSSIERAYRSMCDGYLIKPIERSIIIGHLHRLEVLGDGAIVEADWRQAVITADDPKIKVDDGILASVPRCSEIATAVVSVGLRITWCNDAWSLLTRQPSVEINGKLLAAHTEELGAGNLHTNLQALMDPKHPLGGTLMMTWRQKGDVRWIRSTIHPLWSDDGVLLGHLMHLHDETRTRSDRDALLTAHHETETLLSSMSALLIGISASGEVIRWNRSAEKLMGVLSTDAVGQPIADLELPWDGEVVQDLLDGKSKDDNRIREVAITVNGEHCTVQLTAHRMAIGGGDYIEGGWLILGTDVTRHKELLIQLGHAQKMESIGQLAAGIAHEINTPIQFVGDNMRFLEESFQDLTKVLDVILGLLDKEDGPGGNEGRERLVKALEDADIDFLKDEVPSAITQSIEGIGRVARIVKAMKDFSHPGEDSMKPCDLNRCVESTVTIARNEYKYVADLDLQLSKDLPMVVCDPAAVNQVVLNLVVNAAHAIGDAIDEGGRGAITVQTRQEGDYAVITVTDTGTGMSDEVRKKIFDPFFTTKDPGKGTGQGLSIAHDIVVNKHCGQIEVQSEIGSGTTFVITLPIGREL